MTQTFLNKKQLSNYLGISIGKIDNLIKNRKLIYNYKTDQRTKNKFTDNEKLEILDLNKLPNFVIENLNLYSTWLEK